MSKKSHRTHEEKSDKPVEVKPVEVKPVEVKPVDARSTGRRADPGAPGVAAQDVVVIDVRSLARKNHELRVHQLDTEDFTITVMCVRRGEVVEERVIGNEKAYLVSRGGGKITVDGRATSLKKGEMVVVPAGAPHALAADDDEDFKLITFERRIADLHPVVVPKGKTRAAARLPNYR